MAAEYRPPRVANPFRQHHPPHAWAAAAARRRACTAHLLDALRPILEGGRPGGGVLGADGQACEPAHIQGRGARRQGGGGGGGRCHRRHRRRQPAGLGLLGHAYCSCIVARCTAGLAGEPGGSARCVGLWSAEEGGVTCHAAEQGRAPCARLWRRWLAAERTRACAAGGRRERKSCLDHKALVHRAAISERVRASAATLDSALGRGAARNVQDGPSGRRLPRGRHQGVDQEAVI